MYEYSMIGQLPQTQLRLNSCNQQNINKQKPEKKYNYHPVGCALKEGGKKTAGAVS